MRLWLQADSEAMASLHYLGSAGPETEGFALVEQYMVVLLTRFLREAGLAGWTPPWVRLRAQSSLELERLPLFAGTRFRVRQRTTSLSLNSGMPSRFSPSLLWNAVSLWKAFFGLHCESIKPDWGSSAPSRSIH